ncbi:hypothetical protein RN629_05600 [Sphingomonadaceae bacterium jetA1]|uniref:hypothetical protein n=1 Tax=Facivitalis istanbulensis TaxID=3075838 RepID=UPI00347671B2
MPIEPLALNHSWPLFEQGLRFDLGLASIADMGAVAGWDDDRLAEHGIGRWSCDLDHDELAWSRGVREIFDWQPDRPTVRDDVLGLYREDSRAAMERLRAYAIRHRRGFTLDVALRVGATRENRWMRLMAAPVCRGARTIALQGLKIDITADYR